MDDFSYVWQPYSGTWVATDGEYQGTGNGGQCYSLIGSPSWTN